jgi:FkbM family methyltransferase
MLEIIKKRVRPTYHKFRRLANQARNIAPILPISRHNLKLKRLGSSYGGWFFVDEPALEKSLVISCGLGEDGSFDVEFASKYDANVIIVDPTPRAIRHFKEIVSRIGEEKRQDYTQTGAQPIECYDLKNIRSEQLQLCDMALWNEIKVLRFFMPSNPSHVSHSIVNFQNNYATDAAFIEVNSITIDKLLKQYKVNDIAILKLDIEGAEVEVLIDMLSKNIYPRQVLVEYDEISRPSKKSKERVESAHAALLSAGYLLINREETNFTYIRQSNRSSGLRSEPLN